MGFTSLVFLVFFPIVYLVYLLMPPKGRAFWLLIASYGFCISFGLKYAVILLISTLAGGGGKQMDNGSRSSSPCSSFMLF